MCHLSMPQFGVNCGRRNYLLLEIFFLNGSVVASDEVEGQASSLTQVEGMVAWGREQCSNKTVDTPVKNFIALNNGKLIFLKNLVTVCWLMNLRFSGITVGWTL